MNKTTRTHIINDNKIDKKNKISWCVGTLNSTISKATDNKYAHVKVTKILIYTFFNTNPRESPIVFLKKQILAKKQIWDIRIETIITLSGILHKQRQIYEIGKLSICIPPTTIW